MPNSYRAQTTTGTFRQSCSIRCDIHAPAETVWALLTDASGFTRWNSTVTSIDGEIAPGRKLAIKVPLDPKRTFKPKVTRFEPGREMVWSDGFAPMFVGARTFTLTPRGADLTEFVMTEVFSGLMLPLIRKSLPDFGPVFETYAADLARAAEGGAA
ncbi:MAG TPA: SRPBCC domain-containing protein [Enhygromyxa sp.]|nr:SRPBCC domain-containing protein [Enhygromyxa sp.]